MLLVTGIAWSVPSDQPTLLGIMEELGAQVGRLARAIMADDLPTAIAAASAIADHPQPAPDERRRLLAHVGADALAFRAANADVHDAAVTVRTAAEMGDRAALAAAFHHLADSCLSCHARFRDRLRTFDRPAGGE
jgi:cytochrome c556